MTEMAVYQSPQALSLVDYQDRAVQRLSDWAQSASAAYEVARRLVGTSFCPAAYRGKPEEATAAILSGLEVGLSPMAALRAFDVIQGQAAPRAITLRAIAQSHGHDMVLVESNNTRCKMKGRRKGTEQWQDITWTMDRARDLGLTGKEQWKKQPGTMLLARATSELARLIAADAILGIGYSAEELSDGATETSPTAAESAPAPTGQRRMSRKPAAAVEAESVDEPADEAEPEPIDAEPVTEERKITQPQLRKMMALFKERNFVDRDDRLEYVRMTLDLDTLESSSDLTVEQAGSVIEALEALT